MRERENQELLGSDYGSEANEENSFFERTKSAITRAVEKWRERNTLPPVSIEIHFAAHGSAEDFKGVLERLPQADILLLEHEGWFPLGLDYLRQVATGKLTPGAYLEKMKNLRKRANFPEHELVILHGIYNSKKAIGFADIGELHPVYETGEYELPKMRLTFSNLPVSEQGFADTLEQAQKDFISQTKKLLQHEREREAYIVNMLHTTLKEVAEAYPALKKKESLRILMSFGSFHTKLFHGIKEQFPDTKMSFSTMPYVYDYMDEVLRRVYFNKPIPERAFLGYVLESIISYVYDFSHVYENSEELSAFLRSTIQKISDHEIKSLFVGQENVSRDAIRSRIEKIFERKGIVMPAKKNDVPKDSPW